MKRNRVKIGLVVTALTLLGAYWAVSAQERPMPENRAPASARLPSKSQPILKKNAPDATTIIPPEVWDVPRPIKSPVEIKPSEIVLTAAQLPPPNFPSRAVEVKDDKEPLYPPPPAPVADPKLLIPPPIPEPTKALIVDPPVKETPKKTTEDVKPPPSTLLIPPPEVKLEAKKDAAPLKVDDPPAKNDLVIPPPAPVEMMLRKDLPPMQDTQLEIAPPKKEIPVLKATPIEMAPPKKEIPILKATPVEIAPPKKEIPVLQATPLEVAPPKKEATIPVPPVVNDVPAVKTLKSFVRIPTGAPEVIREATHVPAKLTEPLQAPDKLRFPPVPMPSGGALVNLQTPSIAVEKRGPDAMRAGETQTYQIVVRNLGGGAAQQIRVEDDMPAGVQLMNAEPLPQMQGNRAAWILSSLLPGSEQTIRVTLKADANVQLANSTSVHVSAASVTQRTAMAPNAPSAPSAFGVRVVGPERLGLRKQTTFDIHVNNSTSQPLTKIVLHAELPDGLVMQMKDERGMMREERLIDGPVEGMVIAPGEQKILKMPATAVKPGRYTVPVKVVTAQGEIAASTEIEIAAEALVVEQAPTTRHLPGRDVDLRIEMANHTGKPLRNVQVATHLPEGFSFLGASDRGLYQANTRTAHWLFEMMPAGVSKTLIVRVNTSKTGKYQNVVLAKADGLTESRSVSTIVLEGAPDLSLRVVEKDNPLEVGRDTTYEIHVQNNGSAATNNVKVNVQFPPGILPKNAQGTGRFSIDRQGVAFEPIVTLAPQGQATFRVLATGQSAGKDQRVRFAVVSDESKTPVERELSVLVYSGN